MKTQTQKVSGSIVNTKTFEMCKLVIISTDNRYAITQSIVFESDCDFYKSELELTLTTAKHQWMCSHANNVLKAILQINMAQTAGLKEIYKESLNNILPKYNDFVRSFNKYGGASLVYKNMSIIDIKRTVIFNSNLVFSS